MRKVRRSRLALSVLVLFLAAHLVCVCASRASAMTAAAADPHACCHPERSQLPEHPPAAECQHCAHARWTAPETITLSVPSFTVSPVLHVAAATQLVVGAARFAPARLGRGSPPSLPIPQHGSVLRL